MTKLSPDARDLIEEARSSERPAAGARARVHARVLAHVGAGAAAGATAALIAADAKAVAGAAGAAGVAGSGVKAAASTTLVLKWIAVIGVAGTMALGAGIARDRLAVTTGAPAPPVSTSTPIARAPKSTAPRGEPATGLAPAPTSVAPDTTSGPVAPPAAPPSSPASESTSRRGTPATRETASPTAQPATPTESPLEAEATLLGRAQAEIRAGHPDKALQALDEPGQTPGAAAKDGVLGEERAAERILALCALGRRDEARTEAQRFLSRFPRSPVAERVRTSCGGDTAR